MGTNLVDFYIEKGWEVHNYDTRPPQVASHGEHWVEGDILDLSHLRRVVENINPHYIIHMAARTDLLESTDIFNGYSSNIEGVRNVIQVASEMAEKELIRVLFASSRLVCKIGYVPAHDDDYCPVNPYGISKVIGEKLIKSGDLNFEWVIFRPTSIWGEWFDSPYIIFFNSIKKGRFFKLIGHKPRKSFGYVGNSVFQIDKLLTAVSNKVNRKTYYICDYPPLELNTWADLINDGFRKSPIMYLPRILILPFAVIGDLLLRLGWNRVPLTTFRLNNLTTEMVYPTNELEEICGSLPYSLKEGVDRTISWMSRHKSRDKLQGKKYT